MYPRNATTPPKIAVGAVVQISDGAVQSAGVSIAVSPEGGTESAGGGTTTYGGSSGIVYYAPTQAETNYTAFVVVAYKTGCIPVSQTIVTTASATSGKVVLSGETHTSAVIPTVTTLTGHTAQTGDCYARIGAPVGLSISADIAGVQSDTNDIQTRIPAALSGGKMDSVVAAADIRAAIGMALANMDTQLAALASYIDTEVSAILAAVDTEVAAIKAKTDNLPASFPTNFASMVITAGGVVDADIEAITGDTDAATRLERVLSGNTNATVGVGSTTTSIVTSSMSPAASVTDQFKGKIISFDASTTTAALRGQSTDITASTAGGVLTVTALTTAPVNGDTFTIS